MPVTVSNLRKWALALPDTDEKAHFEKPSFRVNGKIFATYHPKDNRAMIILDEISQSVFCRIPEGGFEVVSGTWGKQGCTYVDLTMVRKDVFLDALRKGHAFILSKQKSRKKTLPATEQKTKSVREETSRFYTSRFNGKLEITIRNGKKVLDTDNTNYSYGTVQEVWKKTLRKIKIADFKTVLLLGLGGGSVIDLLRNQYGFEGRITAVEIDPVIIEVADKEFDIRSTRDTSILCDDAFRFVASNRRKFDLILVDIFLDRIMPENAMSQDFWDDLQKRLSAGGLIVFNVFHYGRKLASFKKHMSSKGWNIVIHEKINGSNTMIFADRNGSN